MGLDTPSGASDYELEHPGYHEIDVPGDRNGKVRLIEPDLDHAIHSMKWIADPEMRDIMGLDVAEVSHVSEFNRLLDILTDQDAYNWMIEYNGSPVGNVAIHDIEIQTSKQKHRCGSMAIIIGEKDLRGRGLARDVNTAVIDWAFTEGNFEELNARILERNIRSQQTFEALGFNKVGDGSSDRFGRWFRYSMLKKQWEQLRHADSGE